MTPAIIVPIGHDVNSCTDTAHNHGHGAIVGGKFIKFWLKKFAINLNI